MNKFDCKNLPVPTGLSHTIREDRRCDQDNQQGPEKGPIYAGLGQNWGEVVRVWWEKKHQTELICCPAFPFYFPYKPKFRQADCSGCYLLHAGFLLSLFFDPEDEGNMSSQNVSWLSTNFTALYPRRKNSSLPQL
jgi:hypothetical protein